jgi:hypothetical protein
MIVDYLLLKLKKPLQKRNFYRNTAIGRRILFKKTGMPNGVHWPKYARKYGMERAYDRTKYFTKKEFLLSGDPRKDCLCKRENKNTEEVLLMRDELL